MSGDLDPEVLELSELLATAKGPPPSLEEWDAGEDQEPIPPRQWLLGNVICRRFVSSLLADGGTGKTALRVAQALALATGRNLTGENVFQRCRVLLVSLEDDRDELRRRVQLPNFTTELLMKTSKAGCFYRLPAERPESS